MITGKDSWKFLVTYFVVLLVTIGAGCCATTAGGAGKAFGVANMLLGIGWVVSDYLGRKSDEDEED